MRKFKLVMLGVVYLNTLLNVSCIDRRAIKEVTVHVYDESVQGKNREVFTMKMWRLKDRGHPAYSGARPENLETGTKIDHKINTDEAFCFPGDEQSQRADWAKQQPVQFTTVKTVNSRASIRPIPRALATLNAMQKSSKDFVDAIVAESLDLVPLHQNFYPYASNIPEVTIEQTPDSMVLNLPQTVPLCLNGVELAHSLSADSVSLQGVDERFFQAMQDSELIKNAQIITLTLCKLKLPFSQVIDLRSACNLKHLQVMKCKGKIVTSQKRKIDCVELMFDDIKDCLDINAQEIFLRSCTYCREWVDSIEQVDQIKDLFQNTNKLTLPSVGCEYHWERNQENKMLYSGCTKRPENKVL